MSSEILTQQQVTLLEYVRQGLPIDQCARMVGMDFETAINFLQEDSRGMEAYNYGQALHNAAPIITKDLITSQLYEERARSANAAEGVACLREIAKINGLYETKVTVKNGDGEGETKGQKTLRRIQQMDDKAIIDELDAGGITIDLEPEPINRD